MDSEAGKGQPLDGVASPTEEPELEILIDTSKIPATFSITQQRGVIIDEAGNQEFFWMKLTLPFTLNRAIAPDDEAIKTRVQEKLAAPLGSLMLELLHTHEQQMAPVIPTEEIQEYEYKPRSDNGQQFNEETF